MRNPAASALLKGLDQLSILKRKGNLDKDGDIVSNPEVDNIYKDYESINQATASPLAGRIAFGPNAGKYVTRIGSGFGYGEEIPLAKGKRCYSINGFSLHANTHINTHNRQGLEKLIRYISRGPLSNKRLEITKDETVKLQLKTPWANGTSHLLFTPEEFIEKLCALITPPKTHLVRWGGVFAPNSPLKAEVRLRL
ncbi:MAG: transposase [Oligoflexales bacterium]|nr:transposase [Oligoflexales bacterium]